MKKLSVFVILIVIQVNLFAGDIAQFVNLGFSENSKYFMFGQYGINNESNTPYADIFVINVPLNNFALGGTRNLNGTVIVNPGTSAQGLFFNLLENSLELKKQYEIDHMVNGRILYLLINGQDPKPSIEFRDFESNQKYAIALIQEATGEGVTLSSSFYINLVISIGDKTINKKVGLADFKRKLVKSYKIRQIILSPDNKSLVFVIEKEELTPKGINIRYMVETVKID